MTQQHRLITYIIIIAIVLLIAWFGTPSHNYTPRGLFLPASAQQFKAIAPENVTISDNQNETNRTKVGTINIEAYVPKNDKAVMLASERYAVNLAAQHGANHIVIITAGIDPSAKTLMLRAAAFRN